MIRQHGRTVALRHVASESEFKPDTMHRDRFYDVADKCLNCTKTKCSGSCKAVKTLENLLEILYRDWETDRKSVV